MLKKPTRFDFRSFAIQNNGHTIEFQYALDDSIVTETLTLRTTRALVSSPLIDRILFNIHLMLGISYYKAFCPREIQISSGELTQAQADFWNTVYTKGLGEFFFTNQIDFRGLVRFPATLRAAPSPLPAQSIDRALVPLGGGKDSLVTVQLLKTKGIPFDLFVLGAHDVLRPQIEQIGSPVYTVHRHLDPQLTQWNANGALNGHVPISALFGWIALLIAAVDGHASIVLSNESSANEPNVIYHNTPINHQWSKSIEYEKAFQAYIHQYITADITYFSLLRPYSEVAITRLFVERSEAFFPLFTSCNRNFTLSQKAEKRWCGSCAKCAFVFSLLSAEASRDTVIRIFGKDCYADGKLTTLYQQLLGLQDIKPFDCVGTPEEVQYSMARAAERHEYDDTPIMKLFHEHYGAHITSLLAMQKSLYTPGEHCIPSRFQDMIYGLF